MPSLTLLWIKKVKTQIKELAQNYAAEKSEIEIFFKVIIEIFNPCPQNSKVSAPKEGW